MSARARALLLVIGALLTVWVAGILIQRHFNRDPEGVGGGQERDAGTPPTAAGDGLDEPPEFYVSDPSLARPGPVEIREHLRSADGGSLYWTAYYIELVDGRFAFGFSDDHGNTRTIFVSHPVEHSIFVGDEAIDRFRKRSPPEVDEPRRGIAGMAGGDSLR